MTLLNPLILLIKRKKGNDESAINLEKIVNLETKVKNLEKENKNLIAKVNNSEKRVEDVIWHFNILEKEIQLLFLESGPESQDSFSLPYFNKHKDDDVLN